MIIIRTAEHLARVLATSLDPPLRSILEGHRDRLAEFDDLDLSELATFFIFEAGDRPGDLTNASGINIFDDPPAWEYLQPYDGGFELVFVTSDFGEGWVVLIPDDPGTNPALLQLCRKHAQPA